MGTHVGAVRSYELGGHGTTADRLDGPFEAEAEGKYGSGWSKGTWGIGPGPLRWRGTDDPLLPSRGGTVTCVLTLPDRRLRSKPVTYKHDNGRADPNSIVFEMEPMK